MTATGDSPAPPAPRPRVRGWLLFGPAFVASLAYVDPGNVAANLSAGSRYGYALVWVLAVASLMAMVIQYQSAKVGLVTGRTLPQLVAASLARHRWRRPLTWAYGLQAYAIALATDLAEVVGGALALYLLFGTPLWLGGIIVGAVSVWLLWALRKRSERAFNVGVSAILAVVVLGFLGTLMWSPPDWHGTAAGLVPSVVEADAVPLVAAMLGATVMPHAIYLHSGLAIDRHRPDGRLAEPLDRLLALQRTDVVLALLISGSVNVSMLLLGASALRDANGDTIESAYHHVAAGLGQVPAVVLAVGLLASGVGSAVVGTHAGSHILRDLLPWSVRPVLRSLLTIGPAVAVLSLPVPPTEMLVWSQIVLSFGVALAAAPLVWFTGSRSLMGVHADRWWHRLVNWLIVVAVVGLNILMVWWVLGFV